MQLQVLDGDMVAAACRKTLTILVQNTMENVENKIFEVLDIIGEKVLLNNNNNQCTVLTAYSSLPKPMYIDHLIPQLGINATLANLLQMHFHSRWLQ